MVTVWLNSRCIGFFCELHGFGQSRFEIGYHSLTDTIGKKPKVWVTYLTSCLKTTIVSFE